MTAQIYYAMDIEEQKGNKWSISFVAAAKDGDDEMDMYTDFDMSAFRALFSRHFASVENFDFFDAECHHTCEIVGSAADAKTRASEIAYVLESAGYIQEPDWSMKELTVVPKAPQAPKKAPKARKAKKGPGF